MPAFKVSAHFSDKDVYEAINNLKKGISMPDEMVDYCKRDPDKALQLALARGVRWVEVEPSLIDYALSSNNYSFARQLVEYCKIVGGRWSELEDAIKANPNLPLFNLIIMYCNTIIRGRWHDVEKQINEPSQILIYSSQVIRGRWHEKEPEILKNLNIALSYCWNVHSWTGGLWTEFEDHLLTSQQKDKENIILQYASVRGRWDAAEKLIVTPSVIVSYAIDVINGRWREKESLIAKDPYAAVLYAKEVIKGPFPEAEKNILGSPWYFEYFTFATSASRLLASQLSSQFPSDMTVGEVLKIIDNGRNADFEKKLLSSTHNQSKAVWYAINVLKGRWPEMEEKIKKSPKWAVAYARDVLKSRWEEAEKYISKRDKYLSQYALEVIKGKLPDVLHNRMIAAAMRNSKDHDIKSYFEMLEKQNGD